MLDQNKEEESINVVMEDEKADTNNQNQQFDINDESMFLQETVSGDNDKITLVDTIKANLIDIVSTGILSIAALYIFDVLLRAIAGFYVKEKPTMFIIFYLVVSLIYTTVMEYKKGRTIGKKAVNIRLSK